MRGRKVNVIKVDDIHRVYLFSKKVIYREKKNGRWVTKVSGFTLSDILESDLVDGNVKNKLKKILEKSNHFLIGVPSMYREDILVVLYPNKNEVKSVIVIDPFDEKILFSTVDSLKEVKEFLKKSLPFCYQHSEPLIHFGHVYVLEWESLTSSKLEIRKPEDIDVLLSKIL